MGGSEAGDDACDNRLLFALLVLFAAVNDVDVEVIVETGTGVESCWEVIIIDGARVGGGNCASMRFVCAFIAVTWGGDSIDLFGVRITSQKKSQKNRKG